MVSTPLLLDRFSPTSSLVSQLSKSVGITKFPKPFWHAHRQDRLFPRRSPNLYYENGYTKFELTAKYPHLTSGGKCPHSINVSPANLGLTAVNKVIQSHGTVVLGAVVEGGIEDEEDEDGQYQAKVSRQVLTTLHQRRRLSPSSSR